MTITTNYIREFSEEVVKNSAPACLHFVMNYISINEFLSYLYRGIVEMVKTSALQAEDSGFDPPCRDQPGKVAYFVQAHSYYGTVGSTYQRSSHIGQSWTICCK